MKNIVIALVAALAITAGTTLASAAELAPPGKDRQGQRHHQQMGKQGKHKMLGKRAKKMIKRHHHKHRQHHRQQQEGKGQRAR